MHLSVGTAIAMAPTAAASSNVPGRHAVRPSPTPAHPVRSSDVTAYRVATSTAMHSSVGRSQRIDSTGSVIANSGTPMFDAASPASVKSSSFQPHRSSSGRV